MNRHGIILLDKPAGITSFSALYPVKRKFSKKAGHAGTLDKFAEGLLIVLSGQMTKLNQVFSSWDKRYEAVFTFGKQTDTLDPEGTIIEEGPIPELERITEAIEGFKGLIEQVPPQYSAVHVNGKRAYAAVREGKEVQIPSRNVTIHEYQILSYENGELSVSIRCSKGTYIRALARDLGHALGTCAYVTKLVRTHIGPFSIEDAADPQDLDDDALLELWDVLPKMGQFSYGTIADPILQQRISNGHLVRNEWFEQMNLIEGSSYCAVFTQEHSLLAVCRMNEDSEIVSYLFVTPREA